MYLLFLFSVVGRDVPSFSSPPPQLVYSRLPMTDPLALTQVYIKPPRLGNNSSVSKNKQLNNIKLSLNIELRLNPKELFFSVKENIIT